MKDEGSSNTGSPVGDAHESTGTPRGAGRAGRVAERPVVPEKPGNAGGGKGPWVERSVGRKKGPGKSLAASEKVRRLQTTLQAKESPSLRFYSLCDKVWSYEVLFTAWQDVRRNRGTAGTDGTTIANIEAQGVDQWLEELARDLKEGTYRPTAVRQVLIPKKQRGKFRPLGIPCIRDRVAQTAAMLVADLRSRPATGAVCLQTGKRRTRRGQSGAPVAETRPPRGGGRGPVRLLRPLMRN